MLDLSICGTKKDAVGSVLIRFVARRVSSKLGFLRPRVLGFFGSLQRDFKLHQLRKFVIMRVSVSCHSAGSKQAGDNDVIH